MNCRAHLEPRLNPLFEDTQVPQGQFWLALQLSCKSEHKPAE